MSKEQFVKVKVLVERTYLIPTRDGKSYNGDSPEDIIKEWFSADAINQYRETREYCRLGNSDVVIRAEVAEIIDVPEGTHL